MSKELIEEARAFAIPTFDYAENDLICRLADALEEAERENRAAAILSMGEFDYLHTRIDRLEAAIRRVLDFIGDGCTPGCCSECEAKNEVFDYLRPILDDALKGED